MTVFKPYIIVFPVILLNNLLASLLAGVFL